MPVDQSCLDRRFADSGDPVEPAHDLFRFQPPHLPGFSRAELTFSFPGPDWPGAPYLGLRPGKLLFPSAPPTGEEKRVLRHGCFMACLGGTLAARPSYSKEALT